MTKANLPASAHRSARPPTQRVANGQIVHERLGVEIPASAWFKHAEDGLSLKEMKISADQFDYILTLLVLPRRSKVWAPRNY